MTTSKHRSFATTLRLSLIAGVGALGWMALGATSATAAEAPSGSGLLGSASGVVGSASAPAATAVQALTEPVQTVSQEALPGTTTSASQLVGVPLVPDVIAQVPQLVAKPAGTVVPPVASLVDSSVVAVPIVQSLVPAGTVTSVTSPVVTVVDGAVGGVSDPVLDVVAPVVEVVDPVLEVVAPVVEVVAPVVEVVDPVVDVVAPVVEVVDPVVDVVAPVVEVVDPVVDVVAPGADDLPAGTVPAPGTAVMDGALGDAAQVPAASAPGSLADPVGAGNAVPVEAAAARGSAVSKVDRSSTPLDGIIALMTLGQASNSVVSLDALVLPALTAIVSTGDGAGEFLAAPAVTSASALSSAGGAGAGTPLAALGGSVLLMFLMLTGRGRLTATPGLPAGPSFDPGSSPD